MFTGVKDVYYGARQDGIHRVMITGGAFSRHDRLFDTMRTRTRERAVISVASDSFTFKTDALASVKYMLR